MFAPIFSKDMTEETATTTRGERRQLEAAVEASLKGLLEPHAQSFSSRMANIATAQALLGEHIDRLTTELAEAVRHAHVRQDVEGYVAKLRACRMRVDALRNTLTEIRDRLVRVHQHTTLQVSSLRVGAEQAEAALKDDMIPAKDRSKSFLGETAIEVQKT